MNDKLQPVITPPASAGTYILVFRDNTEEECHYSIFHNQWNTRRTDMVQWRIRDERDQLPPNLTPPQPCIQMKLVPTNEELCERVEDALVIMLKHKAHEATLHMTLAVYGLVKENPCNQEIERVLRNVNLRLKRYSIEE